MKQFKLTVLFTLCVLTGCAPKIKNDNSIGPVEAQTYQSLIDRLTTEMKSKFNGNMYQNEKITPVETKDAIKIGIPGVVNYAFRKDNSKFVKGDLNYDNKTDLVICANMTVSEGYETKKYFVFLQGKDTYEYFVELKADDMVAEYCHNARLNEGIFNLDSISGGLLIGNTDYQGNHEPSFVSFSYRIATEKYKLNIATKELETVYQSDLLKMNDVTGKYETIKNTEIDYKQR